MMNNRKALYFEVESYKGNKYVYDVASNLVFIKRNILMDVLNQYRRSNKREIIRLLSRRYSIADVEREYGYVSKQVDKFGCFFIDPTRTVKPKRYTVEETRKKVANAYQLILETTQNCNFSCKYCAFSGAYKYRRLHNATTMGYNVAVDSIDIYFDLLNSNLRSNIRSDTYIAFYGGEPFLNFGLIGAAIEYANRMKNRLKTKIKYTITTNGSLLNDMEYIKFLVANNVRLDVSIDGPKSVQDHGRVFRDGEGTFDVVFGNIKAIRERFPDYYKRNMRFLITLFKEYNIEEIEEFFEDRRYFDKDTISVQNTSEENRIIADITADRRTSIKFMEQINKVQLRYFDLIKQGREQELSNFSYSYLWKNLADKFMRKNYVVLKKKAMYTRTCFPLSFKFFVSADGNFHVCEKINHNFPLGNSERGINYGRIKELWDRYVDLIEEQMCWSCDVQHFCVQCLATAAKDKELAFENCDKSREIGKGYIKYCISALEEKQLSGGRD